jgi:hypothetical protein
VCVTLNLCLDFYFHFSYDSGLGTREHLRTIPHSRKVNVVEAAGTTKAVRNKLVVWLFESTPDRFRRPIDWVDGQIFSKYKRLNWEDRGESGRIARLRLSWCGCRPAR